VPTPLRALPSLAHVLDVPRLYVKDESENPFGTHKDRKALDAVTTAARSRSTRALAIITSGNAGRALAAHAEHYGVPVVAVVDKRLPDATRRALADAGAVVLPLDLRSRRWNQADIETAASQAVGLPCLDVSNHAAPYAAIAAELVTQLALVSARRRHVVVVPVGGAELFVGVARELSRLAGHAGLDVRLVGATTRDPATLADKLYCSWSPYWGVLETLTADGSPHSLVFPDERGLSRTLETVSSEVVCEASSALAFHALPQIDIDPGDVVTVVNTGTFRSAALTKRTNDRSGLLLSE
jgi:threonine dehydratase